MNKKWYFTSESVSEGHPDKLCDYISDTILDEAIKQDKYSRVAVETFASANQITIAGQLTTNAILDIEKIVRARIKEIGYDRADLDIDYKTCKIDINITQQSSDIAQGVDVGGAGDQGIMFGYASDETEEYMPFAISMAHKLAKRLTEVRKNGIIPYLRPDGKTQVTVEYEDGIVKRIDTILISNQHEESADMDTLKKDIMEKVIKAVIPEQYLDENTKYFINPTGRFVIGGPLGDTGLTGSAAYMMRHIAKNIVANGFAKKCELQVAYAIGVEQPMSIFVDTFGTNTIPEEKIEEIIKNNFDLTPKGIIEYLGLREPIYTKTTNYGHFGKPELPWEKIIKLEI